MKLNKEQLNEVVNLTLLTQEEQALDIDSEVFAYMSDQLDNLMDSIVSQGSKIFTYVDFQPTFSSYIYSNYLIKKSLVDRGFSNGDIIKTVSLSQSYIFLKLTKVFEYFQEIEYYEGCANINYVKSVFSNFGRSKEFKKLMRYL